MGARLDIRDWQNIFRNLEEENEEVEVVWLDGGSYGSEWCLCFDCELFEDGFATEKEAMQRLEDIQTIMRDGMIVVGYFVDYNGDETMASNNFVAIDEGYKDKLSYYCPIGQHSHGDRDYIKECKEITKEQYMETTRHFWTPTDYL